MLGIDDLNPWSGFFGRRGAISASKVVYRAAVDVLADDELFILLTCIGQRGGGDVNLQALVAAGNCNLGHRMYLGIRGV